MGVTAKFQSQTFKVARYRVRGKVDAQDVAEVDWNPVSEVLNPLDGMPSAELGETQEDDRFFWGVERIRMKSARFPLRGE